MIEKVIQTIQATAEQRQIIHENDYENDGLLYCGHCHTPKQHRIVLRGEERKVPVVCRCRQERIDREEALDREKAQSRIIKNLIREGVTDKRYLGYTFAQDDGANPNMTALCQNFVEQFLQGEQQGGLLFCGNVGTGKTFFACCIANALFQKGIPVAVTNLATIITQLQDFETKNKVIPRLARMKLVVLDDLGAERNTSFGKEQVFNVIDSLVRSDTEVIVTSNLSPQVMTSATDLTEQRIYDRVLHQLCPVHVPIVGESRRKQQAKEIAKQMRHGLGL